MEHKFTEITERIIKGAFNVHLTVGAGFEKKVYRACLNLSLANEQLQYAEDQVITITYLDKQVGEFTIDYAVEDKIAVIVTVINGKLPDSIKNEAISRLRHMPYEVCLVLNFGNDKLDIKRYARYKKDDAGEIE